MAEGPALDRVASEGLRGTPEQVAESLSRLAETGASHITIMLSPVNASNLDRFGVIINALNQKHR
ncbi:MAG: hypothetical protein JOZ81_22345 [Chloroflexi bacterium]|nr:hypothetical protein [Chloroflexota bacterium]MBV9545672.1 hypothetical protein [Chloroflexota bacterium]